MTVYGGVGGVAREQVQCLVGEWGQFEKLVRLWFNMGHCILFIC